MRSQLTLLALSVIGLAFSANAAPNKYVSQQRSITASFSWQTQQQFCNQTATAPDFEAFVDEVNCLQYASAEQGSALNPHTITTSGLYSTGCGLGCAQAPWSETKLSVDFQITEGAVFSLRGKLMATSTNGNVVKLTGPGGIVTQHSNPGAGNVVINSCGTLAPGQYNFFFRGAGGSGHFGTHDVTLRVMRPGDITLDDAVNVDDLLAVINAWGACPSPQNCDADLTCNGGVTVDDLLIVLDNWS